MDVAHEQFAQMAFLSPQECGRGVHGFKIYLVFCNLQAKKKKKKNYAWMGLAAFPQYLD